jgi:hypothetical protein
VSGSQFRAELQGRYPDAAITVKHAADGTRVTVDDDDGEWHVYAAWGHGPSVLRDVMLGRRAAGRHALRDRRGASREASRP